MEEMQKFKIWNGIQRFATCVCHSLIDDNEMILMLVCVRKLRKGMFDDKMVRRVVKYAVRNGTFHAMTQ